MRCLESYGVQYVHNKAIRYAELKTHFPLGRTSKRLVPRQFHSGMELRSFGLSLRDTIQGLERECGRRYDLVFFTCLFEHEKHLAQSAINALRRPWSGLNTHARVGGSYQATAGGNAFTLGDLFQDDNMVSVAVIDEEMTFVMEQSLGKPVIWFPEITQDEYRPDHPLERRFRRFANGSKLVLSIGHLRPNKGILNLAKVALDPSAADIAFGFAGEISWGMFTPQQRESMERLLSEAPSAIFHLARIPDGEEYNAIFCSGDVIFAAYQDFFHSSNTLTKAAIFERPLIVSDGHLMAKRVREFHLGEVVPQDNPNVILQAIRRLADDYPGWLARNNPRWKDYREANSYSVLLMAFTKVLANC